MRIGIGCTTFNRAKHLKFWTKQFVFNSNFDYQLHIADDTEDRKGIAYRKNECLRALKDCDYIFLFDDDCFPIKEGWAEFFIEASKASAQQHFMYLKETPMIKWIGSKHVNPSEALYTENTFEIKQYNNCSGCMMFFTKEVIEKVGSYNPAYGIYGFEHAGYSNRIHSAGLTPLGAYTCPEAAGEYIYSLDFDNHLLFNKELNHNPSIEVSKINEYVEDNKKIYLKDTDIYIPL